MDYLENQLILQGKMLSELNRSKKSRNIHDYEFRVFSQWGEDGIIQYLINKIPTDNKTFIEFGVENYQEANTRFLLQNDNWSGLVIDGDEENINYVKRSGLYWRHSLTAISKFITKDNINDTIKNAGMSGDIGLLSIDVDGNDYWILEAIDCIKPRIVIIEYNSLFGKNLSISVPYDENFDRIKKHYSGLYWGASISALVKLANEKGYSLVGSNSAGVNLFFVKNEFVGDLNILEPQDAYIESKFRQSRDEHGNLTYLDNKLGARLIEEMEVINILNGAKVKIRDLSHYKS
jgi:hypothetical protein